MSKVFAICKACNTPIYFIKMKKSGKKMPVNAQIMSMAKARRLYPGIKFLVDGYGRTFNNNKGMGYVPHWITCKDPDKFHKKENKNNE